MNLNLLLIEDNPNDEILLIDALETAGFVVDCLRIETSFELYAALEGHWHVVISDYNLPTMNGLEALKIVQQKRPDLPFFFVSGIVPEQVGLQAMQAGAKDYMFKDNLDRLALAVERELQVSEKVKAFEVNDQHYRTLLDHSAQAIVSIDANKKIQLFNTGAEQLFQRRSDEVMQTTFSLYLAPFQVELFYQQFKEFVDSDRQQLTLEDFTAPLYIVHKSQKRVPVGLYISRITHEEQTSFLTIIRDISDSVELLRTQKSYSEQLETEVDRQTAKLDQARLEALNLAQAKSEFLASMSHEIRTPMNAIIGISQILEKQHLPPATIGLVQKLKASGHNLLGIINDILDFSKIESGMLSIEHVPFNLGVVLENLATIMSASRKNSDVELAIIAPPKSCWQLSGDSLRLSQILINLTGNAIKFTKSGKIEVRIECNHVTAHRVSLVFKVIDTGIGMTQETCDSLFQPFTQADSSTSRHYGGTGLGLSITKKLVELMNGRIEVSSQPQQGTTFQVELDFDREAVEQPITAATVIPKQVLVVDDNDFARMALKAAIESLNWPVKTFSRADTLLEQLLATPEWQSGEVVIVSDWDMEPLDGLAFIEAMQAQLTAGQRPTTMLISGHDFNRLAEITEPLGVIPLSKPVVAQNLLDAYQASRGEVESTAVVRRQALKDISILVVDDNAINLEVAQTLLKTEGARVHCEESGHAAIRYLQQTGVKTDVILMDIQMPDLDGYMTTEHLRKSFNETEMPVIGLSANVMPEDKQKARQAGMNDYLGKPLDLEKCIEKILAVCQRPESQQPDTADLEPRLAVASAADASHPKLALIDRHFIAKNFARHQDLYHRMLNKFAERFADLVIDDEDSDALMQMAHNFKGAAGNLGLKRLAEASAELEAACKFGAETRPKLITFKAVLSETLQRIDAFEWASVSTHRQQE